jgi:hypothetical protein
MNASVPPCNRESEVLDLIGIGQWPARADAQLAGHVASCPHCSDLVVVASAIVDERDHGEHQPRLPDAGIVWLRAQLRARDEARRRAARPLLVAQIAGAAVVIAILAMWSGGLMDRVPALAASGWAVLTDLFARQPAVVTDARAQSSSAVSPTIGSWLLPALIAATLAAIMLAVGVSRLADDENGL